MQAQDGTRRAGGVDVVAGAAAAGAVAGAAAGATLIGMCLVLVRAVLPP